MQIAIVLYPGVTMLDAIGPYEVLHNLPGVDLRFVSVKAGSLKVDSGLVSLVTTHSLADTPAPDLVLVPGAAANTLAEMGDQELLDWLREVHKTTTWTTSVCSGALILGAAGILKGHPATTHWAAMAALPGLGAEPRPDERIVRSGKIVTAAGVSAGIDLALWLAGQIAGQEQAEAVQLLIEYDPRPPYDAGHISKASPEVRQLAEASMAAQIEHPQPMVFD
ncbi:DJ-1/PfpI family protein [Fodinicola feengrottensis]|uniref:DJ-1/PfpI family protein n=1 Tax=Fodinicola feengrottensis TaxID=435914 RepID=A0ABP4TXW8_9ACTN|nr:DJ-1/PfpI family protein [Fodinicola feengrottensis]